MQFFDIPLSLDEGTEGGDAVADKVVSLGHEDEVQLGELRGQVVCLDLEGGGKYARVSQSCSSLVQILAKIQTKFLSKSCQILPKSLCQILPKLA